MPKTSKTYEKLKAFVSTTMRMSHIYQPVMLMELLKRTGSASVDDISRALLSWDPSQIEYYGNITRNMVGRVLTRNHEITEKQGNVYHLSGFDTLSEREVESLIELCMNRIEEYIEKRGENIWSHRRKSSGYISGTLKYEVLRLAKFRCGLCGISADEKALEVDHILPRNRNGTDDISNLQALCYSCNAMKRDRDDTDFRQIAESYNDREVDCVFCHMDKNRIEGENELCYVINDLYPVTTGHSLIIPKRHVADFFDLYQPEINAIHSLLKLRKEEIQRLDEAISGFNVGINAGEDAGQTVFHCHIHLIPRRRNDHPNPRGGVRAVIPEKQTY